MTGVLTISLDFELHWGVFDKRNRDERLQCYKNTLSVIHPMLDLFLKYNVHVTWACVGSLFALNFKDWESLKPDIVPLYENINYSPYVWVHNNGIGYKYYEAHFAPQTVQMIAAYPGQEIGSHTFSHYYCLEKINNKESFTDDLKASIKAFSKFNLQPTTLVFPRNQISKEHLKICKQHGIQAVRTNPEISFWQPIQDKESSLQRKVMRTGDTYFPLTNQKTYYSLNTVVHNKDEPIQLPASRFLRPYSAKYKISNTLSMNRIKQEMQEAAIKNACYHLWWHPENFGYYPNENLERLEEILRLYKKCNQKFGMQSWNMQQCAAYLA